MTRCRSPSRWSRRRRARGSRCRRRRPARRRNRNSRAPSAPRPCLHRFDLGTAESCPQPTERRDVAARQELHTVWRACRRRRVAVPTRSRDFERGLFGARHEHHLGADHVGDRTREERIVGATEHEGVDIGRLDRREQSFGEHVHLIGVDVAGFDELDEARAGGAGELERMRRSAAAARWYAPEAMVPTVPITPIRPVRCRASRHGRPAR